jgi:hypothetical protein
MKQLNFTRKSFLKELVKTYGYTVQDTYKEIACKIGGVCYCTARNYLLNFEKIGILTIENKGKYNQAYYLDKDKVDRIING